MAPSILLGACAILVGLAGRSAGVPSPIDPRALSALGPLAASSILRQRDEEKEVSPNPNHGSPGRGVIEPHSINNNAVFAIFGIIGAALVLVGIWFFFWARNGGFYFKEGDWDDYKSTVLRRKGPNGTTLSGATTFTDLGGGSVYKDVDDATTTVTASSAPLRHHSRRSKHRDYEKDDDGTTEVSTALTGITGGVSDVSGRERRKRKREAKERERLRRRERSRNHEKSGEGKHSSRRRVGADGLLIDEEAEQAAEEQLRAYRHERPARVGGINKESDSSAWGSNSSGGGTGPDGSTQAATSDLLSNRESTPTNTPTKTTPAAGGIRKVYSTADRAADREQERIRAEARRLQERGRGLIEASPAGGSGRRDFSYQRVERHGGGSGGSGTGTLTESYAPGAWAASEAGTASSDAGGTKVYPHHIPGLSSSSGSGSGSGGGADDYVEEKRRRRGGAGAHRRG